MKQRRSRAGRTGSMRGAAALGALLALAGCGGGETNDFGGSENPCENVVVPNTVPSEAHAAMLEQVRAAYAGSFESTLSWTPLSPYVERVTPPPLAPIPTGYEPSTRIALSVALGEPTFLLGRLRDPYQRRLPGNSGVCLDEFQVPVTVEIATADGAVQGTATDTLRITVFGTTFRVFIPYTELGGDLDLHLPQTGRRGGGLHLSLRAYPEGIRGYVSLEEDTHTPGPVVTSYAGLGGTFPDDGCGTYGFPVAADQPLSVFDGQSANEVLAGWDATLGNAAPIGAIRRDEEPSGERCAVVDLSFDIGGAQHVCYSSASAIEGWSGGFSFSSDTSRMRSADGLIDLRLREGLAEGGELYYSPPDRELVPADQFTALTGIGGVDAAGSAELEYSTLGVSFTYRPDAPLASGFLVVSGSGRQLMNLTWGSVALSCP